MVIYGWGSQVQSPDPPLTALSGAKINVNTIYGRYCELNVKMVQVETGATSSVVIAQTPVIKVPNLRYVAAKSPRSSSKYLATLSLKRTISIIIYGNLRTLAKL